MDNQYIRYWRELQAKCPHQWEPCGGIICICYPDSKDGCSLPMNKCEWCGKFDFGDNPEGKIIRDACPKIHKEKVS